MKCTFQSMEGGQIGLNTAHVQKHAERASNHGRELAPILDQRTTGLTVLVMTLKKENVKSKNAQVCFCTCHWFVIHNAILLAII